MVKSLDKKWKEFLYAASGFGPNFLMVMMGAYFTDAINPSALGTGASFQTFATGACYIVPAIFPILYAISKAFDGIIDIPFAHISDTLSTKWGRRRPAILVCLLPMVLAYAMCWLPIGGTENQTLNHIIKENNLVISNTIMHFACLDYVNKFKSNQIPFTYIEFYFKNLTTYDKLFKSKSL